MNSDITLPDGTFHSISRKCLVIRDGDELKEDLLQPDPSSSDEAKSTKVDYDDPNLPQSQPLQKPELLSPGKTSMLIFGDPSHGFIGMSNMEIEVNISGESTPQQLD